VIRRRRHSATAAAAVAAVTTTITITITTITTTRAAPHHALGVLDDRRAMELRVGNKYRLGRKIGSGSFGDIYLGEFFRHSQTLAMIVSSLTQYHYPFSCHRTGDLPVVYVFSFVYTYLRRCFSCYLT